jgi:replicative DNA helicase
MDLSVDKIKQELAYIKALKKEIDDLRGLLLDEYITQDAENVIRSEIIKLESVLSKHKVQQLGEIDQDFLNTINITKVEAIDLEDKTLVYLYDKLIVKAEITLIAAKPSSGKSLTTMALSNMSLQNNISYVFYFDLDNSPTTLKKRGIDKIEKRWGDRFQYHSPIKKKNGRVVKKEDIWNVITKLKTRNLQNILIVFDSAKNFLKAGADRDKNKDVSPLMDFFRVLRDLGATVILLHHTNKPNKDLGELTYAGSSAWEEDSSNAFLLSYNDYKKTFIFTPFKNRIGDIEEIAFVYKEENHSLSQVEVEWAKETQLDEVIRDEIIDFIKTSHQKPIYSQIMKHMQELGFTNKDKVNAMIQAGKNKYWKTTKIPEKNFKDVYELMERDARISQISPFSSDKSVFRGVKGNEVLSDKSFDTSDKSSNMNIDKKIV